MQHIITPFSKAFPPYVWWENAFTEDEINWLQTKAKNTSEPAAVFSGINTDIRRSYTTWLRNTPDTMWLFDRLASVVAILNRDHYKFDITGFGEPIQLAAYESSDLGTYGRHQDYGAEVSRKLSLVLQLTDPSEYDGGNLEILTSGEPLVVRKQRGLISLFPSYQLHQVTPVTSGSRQSLVAWISGTQFR